MKKTFWLILGGVVAALIGIFALSQGGSNDQSQQTTDHTQIQDHDHTKGNPDAKVTLVEYGDFQCPACKAAEPLLGQLMNEYSERVRLVFRHFPLSAIHPNAFAGARAAEAAAAQGKFWEMHDLLYQRQDQWAASSSAQGLFREYATELGLNLDQFNEAYNSDATTDRINRDIEMGRAAGATATPTFMLNGQKLEPNPRNYQELKAKIEAALGS